ncbi:ATP/GTP-binding protein [Dehalobacter sp. TBBPA1]|uniref:AAA family ATPase n=1 Tax=Dehalobacter sp. TBBPA1 TaxID=3235037 RepID=UPI0034A4E358
MLSEFKVGNFLSFDEVQTISMEAGKVRSKIDRLYLEGNFKLLKFMAIYGANASGKSNLVSAFDFAQTVIVRGVPTSCSSCYCRLKDNNKNKPTHFEFTIKIGNEKYIYGFDLLLSSSSFVKEYLKQIRYGTTYKTVFSRDISTGKFEVNSFFKDSAINERLKIYAEDIKEDSSILFLRLMNQNKDSLYSSDSGIKIYKLVYNWFKYKLSVNYPDRPITNYSYLMDSESVLQIGKLLSSFGTGVSEFVIADIALEKVTANLPKDLMQEIIDDLNEQKKLYKEKDIHSTPAAMLRSAEDKLMFIVELEEDNIKCKTLEFKHERTNAIFSLEEESDGTIRLLDLIEVLLTKDNERIYIIDEINRRFHPLLTYKFIEEYLKLATARNIQLIVTTHESKLMNFDLLRKDEIGFIDKDENGRSTIFSLDTFSERFDKKVCKAYFEGNYGAIPRFHID